MANKNDVRSQPDLIRDSSFSLVLIGIGTSLLAFRMKLISQLSLSGSRLQFGAALMVALTPLALGIFAALISRLVLRAPLDSSKPSPFYLINTLTSLAIAGILYYMAVRPIYLDLWLPGPHLFIVVGAVYLATTIIKIVITIRSAKARAD